MAQAIAPVPLTERLWNAASAPNWNIRHLYLDTAWQGVMAAGISTYLSIFVVRLGASNLYVGLLTALPALVAALLAVPVGTLVEGRDNPVAVSNRFRTVLRFCYLLVALVPFFLGGGDAALAIVLIWGLSSIASVALSPPWYAVIAAIVPPRIRPYVNGNRWALVSIITAATVPLFGKLLDSVSFPANYQIVFFASFVTGLVSVYHFGQIRLPKVTAGDRPPRPGFVQSLAALRRSLATSYEFRRFVAGSVVYQLGTYLAAPLFAIYWVHNLQASNTLIGLRTSAAYGILVLGYVIWGRVAVRLGHRRVLIACGIGTSVYPVLTALVPNASWLIPVAMLWGAFAAGIDIAFFECLLRSAPAGHVETFSAVSTTVTNITCFIAPIAGTLLADALGIQIALVAAGVLILVGAMLFYVLGVGRIAAVGAGVYTGTPGT